MEIPLSLSGLAELLGGVEHNGGGEGTEHEQAARHDERQGEATAIEEKTP